MSDLIIDRVQVVENPFQIQRKARRELLQTIERSLRANVAVLYHNVGSHRSLIDEDDGQMLEAALSTMTSQRDLVLMVQSNGGLPLAAERLVKICRTYTSKKFKTLVVGRAKSAATMICLGSDEILMKETAELGPIDPQIVVRDQHQRLSVDSYIDAYDNLQKQIAQMPLDTGNPSGLLQMLGKFDAAHVEEMRKVQQLGRDIANKFLSDGMLAGESEEKINKVIDLFSRSSLHNSHGRAIWPDQAQAAGVNVTVIDKRLKAWAATYELLERYNYLCQLEAARDAELVKCFETVETFHCAAAQGA